MLCNTALNISDNLPSYMFKIEFGSVAFDIRFYLALSRSGKCGHVSGISDWDAICLFIAGSCTQPHVFVFLSHPPHSAPSTNMLAPGFGGHVWLYYGSETMPLKRVCLPRHEIQHAGWLGLCQSFEWWTFVRSLAGSSSTQTCRPSV